MRSNLDSMNSCPNRPLRRCLKRIPEIHHKAILDRRGWDPFAVAIHNF